MDRIAKEARRVHRHPHLVTDEWGKEYKLFSEFNIYQQNPKSII